MLLLLLNISYGVFGSDVIEHAVGSHTFSGKWVSPEGGDQRDIQSLEFTSEGGAIFARDFLGQKVQKCAASAEDKTVLDDIVILKLQCEEKHLTYKLVLSGWSISDSVTDIDLIRLYGMLYLYRDGRQFNGFPVAYVPAS